MDGQNEDAAQSELERGTLGWSEASGKKRGGVVEKGGNFLERLRFGAVGYSSHASRARDAVLNNDSAAVAALEADAAEGTSADGGGGGGGGREARDQKKMGRLRSPTAGVELDENVGSPNAALKEVVVVGTETDSKGDVGPSHLPSIALSQEQLGFEDTGHLLPPSRHASQAVTGKSESARSSRNRPVKLTEKQREEIGEAFRLFDRDGGGSISVKELQFAMRSLGLDPSKAQLRRIIGQADLDGDGVVDFEEFLTLMTLQMEQKLARERMRQVFEMIDTGSEGFLDATKLVRAAERVNMSLTEEEAQEMIRVIEQSSKDDTMDLTNFLLLTHSLQLW
ncbi:Caltractin [Porphyridium purpureum]|uniref:Caltractin n=1 Tax=Porphyridium purpureum TaxID=35688 RepID=A0A5J4YQF8_PORPP|nr:Caltractin [Porphyridium purpureum]|eukprot:POR4512..scf222_8